MIKGKPIVAAISVAWASSISSLVIPYISSDYIVDYNIVRYAMAYLSRKLFIVNLNNAPGRRMTRLDCLARLFVVLFVHKCIISQFSPITPTLHNFT